MEDKTPYLPEDFYKWVSNGDGMDLIYNPPVKAFAEALHQPLQTEQGIEESILIKVDGYSDITIKPGIGVLDMGAWCFPKPGEKIAHFIPGLEAIQRKKEEEQKRKLEREKERIAKKLLSRQRKRDLEKVVTQELIEKGLLFGEEPKRPPIPRDVVDAVYRRDGGKCVYCGSTENLQLDHIIPFSKGGSTTIENLQLLCQKCNLEKSNKIG